MIKIFDTTLRDGEQSPKCGMNVRQKLRITKQLVRLGVDVIEAGFAATSPGDFEAIKRISGEVEGAIICSLARAKEDDIKVAWEALKNGKNTRIHTFHSTSDIHLKYQFRVSREEAIKRSVEAVKLAKSFTADVEFSPMDATRTDISYLCEVIEAVIKAGATTVNIPDTVGYTIPSEFAATIRAIFERVENIGKAVVAVHCHNDLGLASANTLAAVLSGAGQIECTINGIGERAGNCSLEEVVMALRTRRDIFNADTKINTKEIMRSSRLIAKITGMSVQRNKAIVGANAFAHEAGIHQDGLLKHKSTYEIIKPKDVGAEEAKLILGKHSGRHAFKTRLEDLDYELSNKEIDSAFKRFKKLADQKKEIYNEDIEAIVSEELAVVSEKYLLVKIEVHSGTHTLPEAKVTINIDGENIEHIKNGDGTVDAVFKAIVSITNTTSRLLEYEVKAITGGTDALGEVAVTLEEVHGENIVERTGTGSDTDIIVASAKAYLNALNKLAANGSKKTKFTDV
jgi:2-isopropylmalate synthase